MIITWARLAAVGLAVALLWSGVVWAQAPTSDDNLGTFGFGLESTGSACCLSVRFWVGGERGSEMVLNAYDTHVFVTLRGLQALGRLWQLEAYTGMGMTLRFGQITVPSPLGLLMAVQGFVALEYPFPFYEALLGNVEASLELHPNFGFSATLGLGMHVYF